MVEAGATGVSESAILDAIDVAKRAIAEIVAGQRRLQASAGKAKPEWVPPQPPWPEAFAADLRARFAAPLGEAMRVRGKMAQGSAIDAVEETMLASFASDEDAAEKTQWAKAILEDMVKTQFRSAVLDDSQRLDGRAFDQIRPVTCEVGLLPRTHGAALFTRGETQALVVTTLGTARDAQIIDAIEGERREPFMLHYNFPPYCVGETGMVGSPKRREIGHGRLAKRGVQAVMPTQEDFPYTLRVVSEITESNGSSSMASVCGSSLSLMDAGVPIKAPVAGVAMGLIKEGDQFAVLTDIMGDEDHLGDMDFKVAGTTDGVTALQMDIKIQGITKEIMDKALQQAHQARIHILGKMNEAIASPRSEMSEFAPRIISFRIDPEKIRDVIGKGGVTIRSITEETGASIDISDDGTVRVASVDKAAGEEARRRIELITADVEVGMIYEGRVAKLMDFGAFVTILPGKDGLVHISQISDERVQNVSDKLKEGDMVRVKVLEVDKQGRIRLSMKAVGDE